MSDAASKILDDLFTHCNYLDSVADLIRFTYPYHSDYQNILFQVGRKKKYFENMDKSHDYSQVLRNIRNAWYHEAEFIENNESYSDKMKFTAWKVIQFYYGIYCALSAIVRCEELKPMGHETMINYFTSNILDRKDILLLMDI